MKKFLAILVVMMLLVGCSSDGGDSSSDKIKVALMVGNLGDFSFNDSANEGMKRAEKDFGDKIEYKLIEYGVDKSKEEPAFLQAAEDESLDVIIVSSTLLEYVEEYSADFPDKKFIIFDAEADYEGGKNSNVYSIVYKANEASFLGGYLAAKMSDTGVLGFLGGMDNPVISDFLVGFIQGAKEANENIKVTTRYVGGWGDPAKGKEQSLAMVNQNVSLIFGVAGGSGAGAIEVGKEKNIKILGVDSDQALVYKGEGKEDLAENIVTSVLKNVGNSLYDAIKLEVEGKLEYGKAATLGLTEDGVGLADNEYYQAQVPEALRKEIEDLKAKVASGEIKVDSAYGMTTAEISEIRDSVRP